MDLQVMLASLVSRLRDLDRAIASFETLAEQDIANRSRVRAARTKRSACEFGLVPSETERPSADRHRTVVPRVTEEVAEQPSQEPALVK